MLEVKYLDNNYRIMRYLSKPKKFGKLFLAHLDCLKKGSNDYNTLLDIENRRNNGEDLNELIPWTDGEFDISLVKAKFKRLGLIEEVDFNNCINILKSEKIIKNNIFEAEDKAIIECDKIDLAVKEEEELKKLTIK